MAKKLKLWFDEELAKMLSSRIETLQSDFNSKTFVAKTRKGVEELELKPRVEFIADLLHTHLGDNYQNNCQVLTQILGPENELETGMFTEYYWVMPIAKYVEKYGLDHFDVSMPIILEITKRNTSEYAIRPYLEKYPDKTLDKMAIWAADENSHVRRLASEGVRPRLPWASKWQQFIDDPTPIFSILEQLKDDTSKYVQKSVANCLSDILKDNLEMVRPVIENWSKEATKERKWILKHALRNLIKEEDSWALSVLNSF